MKIREMLTISMVFVLFSCSEDSITNSEPNDPKIESFVGKQNFPKVQEIEFYLKDMNQTVIGFSVKYGEPSDCPAGCVYSRAVGLKVGERIGWLTEVDSTHFDFDSTESYLFTNEFWLKLERSNNWVYRAAFLPLIVKDKNVPIDVLLRIALGLETYIQPQLGNLLLENQKVKKDLNTLTVLSNLPGSQGDAYNQIRKKAKELIVELGV